MKKVVCVVESFAGGVYTFLTELCSSIAIEYEVVIIYSLRKETPQNFREDFNPSIRLIEVDMCRGLNIYKNVKSLIQLIKILNEEKPEIIHLHSSKAGFLGRLACKINRFNMDKVFYNPHGFSFLQQNESMFKRRIFYILESFAGKLGGCIIGCSRGEFEEAKKVSKKCININNGIDTKKIDEILSEKNLVPSKNIKLRIGTAGRICYQKNPDLFNEIASSLPEYEFIWIGDGVLRSKLMAENIKVTGWTQRKEVIKELYNTDIFILTSLWEGLPISLLEAMYMGKTVIVSNVIGNRDVVHNNINGYIANNLKEYIDTINYISQNNIIYDIEFRRLVRLSVLEEYESNEMINSYLKLYSYEQSLFVR